MRFEGGAGAEEVQPSTDDNRDANAPHTRVVVGVSGARKSAEHQPVGGDAALSPSGASGAGVPGADEDAYASNTYTSTTSLEGEGAALRGRKPAGSASTFLDMGEVEIDGFAEPMMLVQVVPRELIERKFLPLSRVRQLSPSFMQAPEHTMQLCECLLCFLATFSRSLASACCTPWRTP